MAAAAGEGGRWIIVVGGGGVDVAKWGRWTAGGRASVGWSSADELPLEESPLARHLVGAPEGVVPGVPRVPGSQRHGLPHGVPVGSSSALQVCKPVGRYDRRPVGGGHRQLGQLLSYVRRAGARDLLLGGEVVTCT